MVKAASKKGGSGLKEGWQIPSKFKPTIVLSRDLSSCCHEFRPFTCHVKKRRCRSGMDD